MSPPTDAIAAVTHPDPYPFYASLVARNPLYRDDGLRLWVASGAEAVSAVLTSDLCRVRPLDEPVPRALAGTPAGEVFRHWMRMNDGRGHCPFKAAVSSALAALDPARVAETSRSWARSLTEGIPVDPSPERLADFAFRLPVTVAADLLGVPQADLRQMAHWMRSFVPSLAPGCGPERLARGQAAADHLLDLFRSLLADSGSDGLLTAFAREARRAGIDDETAIAANGVGLLFQSHDATAGLIGNTLLALAAHPGIREQVSADPDLLGAAVLETLRYDPPVQNTRRFVARDGVVAGQEMAAGDAILVVLAAANRDPAANPNPDRFDLFRKDRKTFTFGSGVHACPGERLALAVAQAGVGRLLLAGLDLERFLATRAYRPSANGRIPFAMGWSPEEES
jgi:cytochrome P450